MALHNTPEKHDADPPASWVVVKVADRCWHLDSSLGGTLDYFTTKRDAEQAKVSGWLVDLYQKEDWWYRGETPAGWRPWAEVKAEQDRREFRNTDGYRASVAQLAAELPGTPAEENSRDGKCGACGYPVPAHRGLFATGYGSGGTFGVHLHRGCAADIQRARAQLAARS